MRAVLPGLLLLAAAACGPVQPPPSLPASLGREFRLVSRDPVVVIGQDVGWFFRAPLAGQPVAAARAIAGLEWLAATVPTDPRWQTAESLAITGLQQARWEARRALGIPERAPPQAVINGLAGAAQAIEEADARALAASLPPAIFTLGPEETLQRLSQPPSVPSAMMALYSLSRGTAPRGQRD